ncbi:hypothetical protein CCHR01_05327 [Colletotrichum chrysophilum]|uniref:C2H2-type domain-containing protein n=1 Tax=Colletotrichum chrysophilum TaxID=1836956 RepID=A0AAD9AQW3_9PEZI|nr:hypothetical protein CCHR01_05327 [Colletotrichum chrysophilum]
MKSPREADTYDSARIQNWIAEAVLDAPEAKSLVSRLCAECVTVIKAAIKETSCRQDIPGSTYRSLERNGSSLILWADGHDVVHGNLDNAIQQSTTLQRCILEHLASISETLFSRLIPKLFPPNGDMQYRTSLLESLTWEAQTTMEDNCGRSDDGDSEGDSSTVSDSNDWEDIAYDIQTDVECLVDLEPLIQSPFVESRQTKQTSKGTNELQSWTPLQFYSDRIVNRFPHAQHQLVYRLASANWERFQRIQLDKEQNMGVTTDEERAAAAPLPLTEKGSTSLDSGLGPSIVPGSSYAETIMSYGQNIKHSIKIPTLPAEAKKGKSFDCVACGRLQAGVWNNSTWKKHFFNDLRPWICHDISCQYGTEPFLTREDWVQHLALDHYYASRWESFKCPLCLEATGQGKSTILQHLSNHLEEISLSSFPTGVDSDCDDDSDSDSHTSSLQDVDVPDPNQETGGDENQQPLNQSVEPGVAVNCDSKFLSVTSRSYSGVSPGTGRTNQSPEISTDVFPSELISPAPQVNDMTKRLSPSDPKWAQYKDAIEMMYVFDRLSQKKIRKKLGEVGFEVR